MGEIRKAIEKAKEEHPDEYESAKTTRTTGGKNVYFVITADNRCRFFPSPVKYAGWIHDEKDSINAFPTNLGSWYSDASRGVRVHGIGDVYAYNRPDGQLVITNPNAYTDDNQD